MIWVILKSRRLDEKISYLSLRHFERFLPRILDGTPNRPIEKFAINDIRIKLEKEAIINVLQMTKGNRKRASEILQIDISVLYKKMSRYGINVKRKQANERM